MEAQYDMYDMYIAVTMALISSTNFTYLDFYDDCDNDYVKSFPSKSLCQYVSFMSHPLLSSILIYLPTKTFNRDIYTPRV